MDEPTLHPRGLPAEGEVVAEPVAAAPAGAVVELRHMPRPGRRVVGRFGLIVAGSDDDFDTSAQGARDSEVFHGEAP